MIVIKQLRQLSQRLLPLLIIIFYGSTALPAQEDDSTECPYFVVSCSDSTSTDFALIETNVDATISGVITQVLIEQTYVNSGDSICDANYIFPMSSQAAVYAMEMMVNEKLIKAVIKRKAEAQTIFDTANENGQTASLLEQQRPNVFQMSLANINRGDTIRIKMKYTELMVPSKGVYQFVFPNIVGPRYSTGGESWIVQNSIDSVALSQTPLNIRLKINAGMPLQAECKSHPVVFDYNQNSAETVLATFPKDDFIVDYTLYSNEIETGLLLYEEEDENFFLSMIQPARPDVEFESPAREYVFIMDISGSMSGRPLEVSKSLITNLLEDLTPNDKFNIIFFAGSSTILSPQSLPVTIENIDKAVELLEGQNAGGGTNLLPAMNRALALQGNEDYSRTFVILTDGFVTVEKQAYDLIRENLNEANFFAFGIGKSVNRYIIEGIAYVGEGEPFVVTDMEDADEVAATFKEFLVRPAVTNVTTTFSGIEVYDVEPLTTPDVFAERPIIIYGKYKKPAQGTITIEGDYATGTLSNTLNFEDYTVNKDENIALKYLWARKRIKLMSDYGIASNETDTVSIEEEVTLLGLKYSLVTEFTSFVAVDSSALTVVSDPTDDNNDNDDNTVGSVSESDLLSDNTSENTIIKIFGTLVSSGGQLRLRLENISAGSYSDLNIQVSTIDGRTLSTKELKSWERDDTITIDLADLPAGIYIVSLISKNEVLDAEKFVVAH